MTTVTPPATTRPATATAASATATPARAQEFVRNEHAKAELLPWKEMPGTLRQYL
jgi:hypothetical protein